MYPTLRRLLRGLILPGILGAALRAPAPSKLPSGRARGTPGGDFSNQLGDRSGGPEAARGPPGSDDDPRVNTNLSKLPDLDTFTKEWRRRHAKTPGRNETLPSTVQIVLAFSVSAAEYTEGYWQVHQTSWMTQPGVCTLGATPKQQPNCTVYVTRVVGSPTKQWGPNGKGGCDGWKFQADDLLFLNMPENMNDGKTFWLFHALSKSVPFATHIAKVDLDAYPYVHKLTHFLDAKRGCASHLQYMGYPWTRTVCGNPDFPCDPNPVNLSSACGGYTCSDYDKSAFTFHQGGMYLVSRALALGVTEKLQGYYAKNKANGLEDEMFGRAVRQYHNAGFGCVSVFVPHGAWHHYPMVVDPDDPVNTFTM